MSFRATRAVFRAFVFRKTWSRSWSCACACATHLDQHRLDTYKQLPADPRSVDSDEAAIRLTSTSAAHYISPVTAARSAMVYQRYREASAILGLR